MWVSGNTELEKHVYIPSTIIDQSSDVYIEFVPPY